jgi:hypothetical protein
MRECFEKRWAKLCNGAGKRFLQLQRIEDYGRTGEWMREQTEKSIRSI